MPITHTNHNEISYLPIAKAGHFQMAHPLLRIAAEQALEAPSLQARLAHRRDVGQLAEEPLVNLGQFVNPVDRPTFLQSRLHGKQSRVGRSLQLRLQRDRVVDQMREFPFQTIQRRVHHAAGFLDDFLKGPPDGHDFADTQHGRTELVADARELLEVPSRHLDDAVVQAGFEARRGRLGDGVPDRDQILPEGDFSRDVGQRVPRGL